MLAPSSATIEKVGYEASFPTKTTPKTSYQHPQPPPKTLSEEPSKGGEESAPSISLARCSTKRPPSVRPSQKMGGKQSKRKKEELHPKRNERTNRSWTTDERAGASGRWRNQLEKRCGALWSRREEGCKQQAGLVVVQGAQRRVVNVVMG